MFADDLILVSSTKIGLQRSLNQLYEYCCKWKLSVNIDKTKIIVFGRGGGLRKYEKWYYNGKQVSVISFHGYLGVDFSWTGQWFQAQKTLSEQANGALYSPTNCLHKFGTLPIDIAWKLFDANILPILLYGSEIWGFHPAKDFEKMHNKMMRFTLKLYNNTSIVAMRGELGSFKSEYLL